MPVPFSDTFFDPAPRVDRLSLVPAGDLRAKIADTHAFQNRIVDIRSIQVDTKSAVITSLKSPPLTAADRAHNRRVLDAAIQAAVASKRPLFIPPGRLDVDIDPADPSDSLGFHGELVQVAATCAIIGAGAASTVVRFGSPSVADEKKFVGMAIEPGVSVLIEGLTLEGPPFVPTGTTDPHYKTTQAILHVDGPGDVTLRDVRVTGWFETAVTMASSGSSTDHGGDLQIIDCDLQTFGGTVAFWSLAITGKRLYVRNSAMRHTAPSWLNTDGSPTHFLYIHPNVSVELDGCIFGGPPPATLPYTGPVYSGPAKHAFHHWGSASPPGAEFVRIVGCKFINAGAGILTSNGNETVEIYDCDFTDAGIVLRTSARIFGCGFIRCGVGVYSMLTSARRVHVSRCRFREVSTAIATPGRAFWLVERCQFYRSADATEAAIQHGMRFPDDESVLYLRWSTFEGGSAGAAVEAGQRLIVEECTFRGKSCGGVISRYDLSKPATHDAVISLLGVDTTNVLGTPGFRVANGGEQGVYVEGAGNTLHPTLPAALSDAVTQQGALFGSAGPGGLISASANDLIVNYVCDHYEVAGSGKIKNIYIVSEDATRPFAGLLKLTAQDSFDLEPGGNLMLETTTTVAAGITVGVLRDPASRRWHLLA